MSSPDIPSPLEEKKEGGDVSAMDSLDFDIFKGEGTPGKDVDLDPDKLAELAETKKRKVTKKEKDQKEELKRREQEAKKGRKRKFLDFWKRKKR